MKEETSLHKFISKNKTVVPTKFNLKLKTMKSTPLKNSIIQPHLKVIKNGAKRKKPIKSKLYINTLMPDFSFTNHNGEIIHPKKCILL